MNITFTNAVFCDQKGQQYKIDNFMVRFRQILYIQVPDSVGSTLKLENMDRGKIAPDSVFWKISSPSWRRKFL